MIGRTNAGSSKSVALIRVLYPAGTVCTCTNGSITYQSDTSGDYLFGLPSTGNWTVSGTDGKQQEKTITYTIAAGDAKLVLLDTLIPPAYRSTYQEVEYLQLANSTQATVPLGISLNGSGIWEFTVDKMTPTDNSSGTLAIIGASASSGGVNYYTGVVTLGMIPRIAYNVNFVNGTHSYAQNVPKKVQGVFKDSDVASAVAPWAALYLDDETAPEAKYDSAAAIIAVELSLGRTTTNYAFGAKYTSLRIRYKTTETGEYTTPGEFIPCIRRSDSLPGYFNLVDNTFHQGKKGTVETTADVLTVITAGPGIGN